MHKFIPIILLLCCTTSLFGQKKSNEIQIGNRHHITSSILNEDRAFQVYLPPTYFFSDKSEFPVIYLLDGDYNFHYVTGLVELMSNVSGKMPECIVVGISDKGASKYRQNCTPNQIEGRNGNAENYMNFITDELKLYVNKNFRTSDYSMLIGHSIGGLFVTNFLLEKPTSFNAFIAIDPSFWLGDFEIINRAKTSLKDKNTAQASYYVSSSSAEGMGIDKYVEILEKQFPAKNNWKYFNLGDENHNSVGLLTIKKSFEDMFKNWSISRSEFMTFKSAQEVIDHYKELSKKFETTVSIHPYFLGNIMYYYFNRKRKDDLQLLEKEIKEHFPSSISVFYNQLALNYFENKEYQKAIENYNKSIAVNPLSFNSYDGISKVYLAQKEFKKAIASSKKAIEIAKKCNARQWMLNQLTATLAQIQSEMQ